MKKTQDSLEKYIKKPPLTEKLLSKPPFRFLHDIMTSVSIYDLFEIGVVKLDYNMRCFGLYKSHLYRILTVTVPNVGHHIRSVN